MFFLLSEKLIAIYETVIILVLAALLIWQTKKKKDVQERRRISGIKKRNENLEEMLKNPEAEADCTGNPNPFEVQYKQDIKAEHNTKNRFQVKIDVQTETSVKSFLFNLEQEITIGRDEKNILSLRDTQIAEKQCSIFEKNHEVYVKCPDCGNEVLLQRGSNKQKIQNCIVKLQNKDRLIFGKTALHISLYEN